MQRHEDFIIDYLSSPTGKAFIGLAKEPLMQNDNGIGFKGVKLQNELRTLIQCCECGEWYQRLSPLHLKKHGITVGEYKEKFGLNKTTGLMSDALSNYYSANGKNQFYRGNLSNEFKSNFGRQSKLTKRTKNRIEDQNRLGTCPEQLKRRVVNYIHRFKTLPKKHNNRDGIDFSILANRFGSFNAALKHYGLPVRVSSVPSGVTYLFPDGYKVFMPATASQKELYEIMIRRCPALVDVATKK